MQGLPRHATEQSPGGWQGPLGDKEYKSPSREKGWQVDRRAECQGPLQVPVRRDQQRVQAMRSGGEQANLHFKYSLSIQHLQRNVTHAPHNPPI